MIALEGPRAVKVGWCAASRCCRFLITVCGVVCASVGLASAQTVPAQAPPSQYPPSQYPPAQAPPSQYPPSQYPPAQYPPAQAAPPQPGPAPGQAYPQQPYPQQGYPNQAPAGYSASGYAAPGYATKAKSSSLEIGALYATSVVYGLGIGIWFDAELGIKDPGIALIPPTVLGLAAPIGVYVLDQPAMSRGVPAAIAAGLLIGAGEGLGIASHQMVSSEDPWGFRGLSRAMAIGSTAGLAGGLAVGLSQEPPPQSSAMVTSGVVWGSAIGSMFGFGASPAGVGFGRSNDDMSLGGLIGFNVGLVSAAGVSLIGAPSWYQLGWMWMGAGIGAAAATPVFLFYAGEDTPPAKRGFLFMATATTVGLVAGGIFSSKAVSGRAGAEPPSSWIAVEHVGPAPLPGGGVGLQMLGRLY